MIGWGEFTLIVILAILLLGPDKLPEVAREIGRLYAEYKKAKRRLELEIMYGLEPPNEELLEKVYSKNLDLAEESKKSYLNEEASKK